MCFEASEKVSQGVCFCLPILIAISVECVFAAQSTTEALISADVQCTLGVPDRIYGSGFEGPTGVNELEYDFHATLIEGLSPTPIDATGRALGTFQHATADLNGDGNLDAVVFLAASLSSTEPPTPIQVLFNTGDGSVVDCTDELIASGTPAMQFVRDIHLADFNGDNMTDIFFSNTGSEADDPFVCEQNRLLLSDTDGKLYDVTSTHLPQLVDFSHGSSFADIDLDGDLDIFVANLGCESAIGSYMMKNNGVGQFSIVAGGQPYVHAYFTHEGPTWTAFGDFDRDGDSDLFAASVKRLSEDEQETIENLILVNDGLGNFGENNLILLPDPLTGLAQDVHLGDLDGNGWIDIAVMYDPSVSPIVQLLMNEGGTFADETAMRLPNHQPTDAGYPKFSLVDLDRNLAIDILFQGEEAFYFHNDGSGYFIRTNPAVDFHFSSLLIPLDLNADGVFDQIDLVCEAGENFCEFNRWYKRLIRPIP